MIDKTQILPALLRRLARLPEGHAVELLTYKRNRGMTLVRRGGDAFLVLEYGYLEQRFPDVPMDKLEKLCKTVLKREFPRSTKVRLYLLGMFDEDAWRNARRKVI